MKCEIMCDVMECECDELCDMETELGLECTDTVDTVEVRDIRDTYWRQGDDQIFISRQSEAMKEEKELWRGLGVSRISAIYPKSGCHVYACVYVLIYKIDTYIFIFARPAKAVLAELLSITQSLTHAPFPSVSTIWCC